MIMIKASHNFKNTNTNNSNCDSKDNDNSNIIDICASKRDKMTIWTNL